MGFRAGKSRILACALVAAALAAPAQGVAESSSVDVRAILISPIGLAETSRLDFGTIIFNGAAGQVSLSPSGAIRARGVVVSDVTKTSSGVFRLQGSHAQTYTITLPASVEFKGKPDLRIVAFTHDAGPTPSIGGQGTGQFNIGATLVLGPGNHSGIYDGSLVVIVSNN